MWQEVTSTLLWRDSVKGRPGLESQMMSSFKIQDDRPTVKTMRTWLSYVAKQMVSGIFLTSNEQFYEISYL